MFYLERIQFIEEVRRVVPKCEPETYHVHLDILDEGMRGKLSRCDSWSMYLNDSILDTGTVTDIDRPYFRWKWSTHWNPPHNV